MVYTVQYIQYIHIYGVYSTYSDTEVLAGGGGGVRYVGTGGKQATLFGLFPGLREQHTHLYMRIKVKYIQHILVNNIHISGVA